MSELPAGVRRFVLSESLLGIGIGLFSLLLNFHLLALGVREETLGTLNAVGTVAMGMAAFPIAVAARRYGRKGLFISGIALIGTGYLLFAAGTTLFLFYGAQIVMSVGMALLITTEIQLLFHYAQDPALETTSYSLMFAVFTLFTGVGTLLGGVLPDLLGGVTSPYQGSLCLAGAVVIGLAVLRGLILPRETRSMARQPIAIRSVRAYRERMLPGGKIFRLALFVFIAGVAFALIGPFQNVILKFRFGVSDAAVSGVIGAASLFLFFGSLWTPRVIAALGPVRAYYALFALNAALLFVLALPLSFAPFTALFLLRGGAFTMLSNLIESQTMSMIADAHRDAYAAIRNVFRSVGTAGASYVAGRLLERGGYRLPFFITGVVIVLGLIYFTVWIRPLITDSVARQRKATPANDPQG
ncbi:MAG: MFS transporter [Hydrogenibacillus sp.]|nr:MFS transporter [Hydrogenibacillus sp.]